ncbi:MAG: hypothetical protein J2P24_20160 [Streptosporangiales bacterium]|nr:hypothetical protein [Streptosporangiales bacterium]
MSATITAPELAEILFASTLQESDRPTPADVRAAVGGILARDHAAADCLAVLAQEAGDHPDAYVTWMHWALETVRVAYATPAPLAA